MNNQTNGELSTMTDIKMFWYVWESDLNYKKKPIVAMEYVYDWKKKTFIYKRGSNASV